MDSIILARPFASSSLSLPINSYIYCIKAVGRSLAAISTDDSLRLFDAVTLQVSTDRVFGNAHTGVVCLEDAGIGVESVVTAGRDGYVRCWDLRSGKKTVELRDERSSPFLSLAIAPGGTAVAAGTELTHAQATVQIWDLRSPHSTLARYVECHNDDVTEVQPFDYKNPPRVLNLDSKLCYHPSRASSLLSGSTDGLVNLYDTTIADEDDSLIEVFNHEASIHHAGFLTDADIYALSHDEQLSIYRLTTPDEEEASNDEPYPIVYGDMRPRLSCEYIVNIATDAGTAIIAAGSHSTSALDLIPLHHTVGWQMDMSRAIRLLAAHDGEIIRTVYIDGQSSTIYTGGEDGVVNAWRPDDTANSSAHFGPTRTKRKRDSLTDEKRRKPY
ncbi:hypothetical protein MMC26_000381 [Xylographa opegraphella]|nr:hypothetical protein [Xylographa opegraphella]